MKIKFMWIICCVIICDKINGAVVNVNDVGKFQVKYGGMPFSNPRQKLQAYQNVSKINMLVSFANNMFGPSLRVKPLLNFTDTLYLKGYALKTSHLGEIKFDPASINHSLYTEGGSKSTNPLQEQRTKRGVFNLYNMISCATGCDPLIYKGYGCYCGLSGSGYSVDGIDSCCQTHDWCYGRANCPSFLEYIVPYYWYCYYPRPLCAEEHGVFGGSDSCASRICECDRRLSECLSRYSCPSSRAQCRSSSYRFHLLRYFS